MDLYGIQNLLRHAKASTTERYLSIDHTEALKLKDDINEIFDKEKEVEVQAKIDKNIKEREVANLNEFKFNDYNNVYEFEEESEKESEEAEM